MLPFTVISRSNSLRPNLPCAALVALIVILIASPAPGGEFEELAAQARSARAAFRTTTPEDVAQAKVELVDAAQQLAMRLEASPLYGADWKNYLLWDRFTAQLTSQTAPDVQELAAVLGRFQGDYDNLELPVFVRVRHALEFYRTRLECCGQADLEAEYQTRLERLAQLLELSGEGDAAHRLSEISVELRWLGQHEQAPALVSAVRQVAAQPNVVVSLSRALLTGLATEAVDRTDPMTDYVLGTSLYGTSHTWGTMDAVPLPSQGGIRVQARLQGDADTWGRGYNGPVRTTVTGNASLAASGEILFGPEGFQLLNTEAQVSATGVPVSIWTVLRSRLLDRIVTRIAKRRAARTQQQADYIASRHAEQRLERQVGEDVQARLSRMQHDYETRIRNPLLRRDAFPDQFVAESSADEAQLVVLLAASSQLGAPGPAPLDQPQAAMTVQVHQTALENLAARFLAGRTVSEVEVRKFVLGLLGQSAEAPPVDEENMLYITLADDLPISLRIEDQTLTLKMRSQQFIVNQRKFSPMNVTLQYRLDQTADGIVVAQSAEPEITPPRFETEGPGRLSSREISSRRLIRNMLDRDLQTQYVVQTFAIPELADAMGEMVISRLVAENGWLAFAADSAATRR